MFFKRRGNRLINLNIMTVAYLCSLDFDKTNRHFMYIITDPLSSLVLSLIRKFINVKVWLSPGGGILPATHSELPVSMFYRVSRIESPLSQ